MTQMTMAVRAELSLEMRVKVLEADVTLLVNYVRELAKERVSPETRKRIEDEYEQCRCELADLIASQPSGSV